MNQYTSIEFFAGAGGLALGLEKAGFKHSLLLDLDKESCNTLSENRPDWNIVNQDIKEFSDQKQYLKYSDIDLISGGFPCQPFSYAGKKNGLQDARGTVFFYLANIIQKTKPKMILLENVKGLLVHDKGKTFKTICSKLEVIGYNIQYKVLNAWDYNVAQKRERIFIIGIRNDLNIFFQFPTPFDYKPVLKDVLKDVPVSLGYEYPEFKKKVLDLVPSGGCHRDLPENVAKEYMGKSYYLTGGRTGIARRISWDEPSLTLTTSPMQKQTERCHPQETRPFTIREYARIQSFPDNWGFIGSKSSQYKQIGNAVPVNLACAVGVECIKSLQMLKALGQDYLQNTKEISYAQL